MQSAKCKVQIGGWLRGRTAVVLGGLLVVAAAGPVTADDKLPPFNPDRPGIADGSFVVGGGKLQIEIGFQQEYHRGDGVKERDSFLPSLFRYGLDDRWELRIESNTFSHTRVTGAGKTAQEASGYAPVSLGFKYHFRDSRPETGNLSLGTIFRVFAPVGSGGFQTRHVTGDLRLVADWQFAPDWALNPNVGVAIAEDDEGNAFASGLAAVTLTYGPSHRLQPYIDVGVTAPEAQHGRTSVILDGGATYLLSGNTQLDFGVGTGVAGDTPPDLFWTVGVSHRF